MTEEIETNPQALKLKADDRVKIDSAGIIPSTYVYHRFCLEE